MQANDSTQESATNKAANETIKRTVELRRIGKRGTSAGSNKKRLPLVVFIDIVNGSLNGLVINKRMLNFSRIIIVVDIIIVIIMVIKKLFVHLVELITFIKQPDKSSVKNAFIFAEPSDRK